MVPPWYCKNKLFGVLDLFTFMCLGVLTACLSVYRMHACSASEKQRRTWILWNWSYRQVLDTMWVLGTEPLSSVRATSAANCLSHLSNPQR